MSDAPHPSFNQAGTKGQQIRSIALGWAVRSIEPAMVNPDKNGTDIVLERAYTFERCLLVGNQQSGQNR